MPSYKAPLRDLDFVLFELLGYEQHLQDVGGDEALDTDTCRAILAEAGRFAEEVIAPLNHSGDQEGCHWENGQVSPPKGFKEAYDQYVEGGWPSLACDPEFGGQGICESVSMAVYEMCSAANHAWTMYPGLSHGAVATLEAHGTDEQKELLLPKLVSGEWTGTMCLTEAHAGSDLGLLRTKAERNEDGSYSITGSKIFISSGEHNMVDNIVHLVLARLPDAPAGVRGISLFAVPKVQVNSDGSLGENNGVSCGSIEHKMGIHGNATCVMNFDGAKGSLLGVENKGMANMFTFINHSRISVALQATGNMEASYQNALNYALDRVQFRGKERVNPDQPADPIIVHPDVRRMLLTQRAFAEGSRALNYFCGKLNDQNHKSEDAELRARTGQLLALLTPITKGFVSEVSLEATSHGLQCLGGHGFIQEWGMDQFYRDTRITTIYEGTTGIQGLDLLGRKLIASEGKLLDLFLEEMQSFCHSSPYQAKLDQLAQQWRALATELCQLNDSDAIGVASVDFLMYSGYAVMAYMWAQMAALAEGKEGDFYTAKRNTAAFYFERLLPRTESLARSIKASSDTLMAQTNEQFLAGL